jgi:hypothetical protein
MSTTGTPEPSWTRQSLRQRREYRRQHAGSVGRQRAAIESLRASWTPHARKSSACVPRTPCSWNEPPVSSASNTRRAGRPRERRGARPGGARRSASSGCGRIPHAGTGSQRTLNMNPTTSLAHPGVVAGTAHGPRPHLEGRAATRVSDWSLAGVPSGLAVEHRASDRAFGPLSRWSFDRNGGRWGRTSA